MRLPSIGSRGVRPSRVPEEEEEEVDETPMVTVTQSSLFGAALAGTASLRPPGVGAPGRLAGVKEDEEMK